MTVPDLRVGRLPDRLSFLVRPVPAETARLVHRVPAGGRLDCPAEPWASALAVLETGCVEVHAACGSRLHLCAGAVFTLRGLTPAILTAAGPGSAVLTTINRSLEGELS